MTVPSHDDLRWVEADEATLSPAGAVSTQGYSPDELAIMRMDNFTSTREDLSVLPPMREIKPVRPIGIHKLTDTKAHGDIAWRTIYVSSAVGAAIGLALMYNAYTSGKIHDAAHRTLTMVEQGLKDIKSPARAFVPK